MINLRKWNINIPF